MAGLSSWQIPIDRYGILAEIMAHSPNFSFSEGEKKQGDRREKGGQRGEKGDKEDKVDRGRTDERGDTESVPGGNSPIPDPEFVRKMFKMILNNNVEGRERECIGDRFVWLLGLGDFAFEEENFEAAVRFYLQAGADVSNHYSQKKNVFPRNVFTPWVLGRLTNALLTCGATLPAAVLCQLALPTCDFSTAFRVLQETPVIGEREFQTYLDCIWEVPILELLVALHSRSGDEARVTAVTARLQHAPLAAHNPSGLRSCHVALLERKFMRQLAADFAVTTSGTSL